MKPSSVFRLLCGHSRPRQSFLGSPAMEEEFEQGDLSYLLDRPAVCRYFVSSAMPWLILAALTVGDVHRF
jgi:hypothetical protein